MHGRNDATHMRHRLDQLLWVNPQSEGPELTIDAVPQQYVAVDGEVITQTPIRVSVAREALHLMTPEGFEELKIEGQAN